MLPKAGTQTIWTYGTHWVETVPFEHNLLETRSLMSTCLNR